MAVAGILADPDWPETTANMSHDIVNPAVYETLADIMRGKPRQDFPRPSEKLAYGQQRSIPDVTCQPVDAAKSTLESQGFRVEINAEPVGSACPAGSVARTEPAGRTIDGGLVVLRTSNGVAGTPTASPPRDRRDRREEWPARKRVSAKKGRREEEEPKKRRPVEWPPGGARRRCAGRLSASGTTRLQPNGIPRRQFGEARGHWTHRQSSQRPTPTWCSGAGSGPHHTQSRSRLGSTSRPG
ncbi:hypothetical protein Psuf_045890 [Phytohabitans suffuscus]|uniref:PASTA domain-containing protein n=1 Tax=Phytohabitans suffuscus TaxID=624315 RepID=A0A6F8YML3_9ACTN|nr:hypothetical protein Psuf_045890 [Phytohabitans suffuscus]